MVFDSIIISPTYISDAIRKARGLLLRKVFINFQFWPNLEFFSSEKSQHCIKVKVKVKVKVKFTLEQATKAQMGSRGTALLFS